MHTLVAVAEAVKELLNSHAFSMEFVAARRHVPLFDLDELTDLQVTVVPRKMPLTIATRSEDEHECHVDVGVQKRIEKTDPDTDDAQVDALLGLVQEIIDFLRHKRLDAATAWKGLTNEPVVATDHLLTKRAFLSVIGLIYVVQR